MVSLLWLRVEEGSERRQWHCLASGVLSGRKLSPGTHPDARHCTFPPYATGTLLYAAPMLSLKSVADPLRGDF